MRKQKDYLEKNGFDSKKKSRTAGLIKNLVIVEFVLSLLLILLVIFFITNIF